MDRIKVLGIIDNISGSRLHRIKLPLEKLNGRKLDDKEIQVDFFDVKLLTEDIVKNYNVLWVSRIAPIDAVNLDVWKNKYGLKFIIDIDDCIEIDSHVFNYQRFKLQEPLVIRQVVLADLVIVSSLELVNEVGQYNTNLVFIPNAIPFEEGQFKMNEKEESEKVRFGIIGSVSHYYDYLSLRSIMKKVMSDTEFQKKGKFVIAADETNKWWKDVISVFKHKNVELEILPLKGLDDYMDLYDKVDVVLAPLEDNRFNRVRTNLKMFEAACKEIPVIGSELFLNKGGNFFVPVSKKGDWYKAIKLFIKNRDYKELGGQIKKFLMEKFPYENVVTKRMDCLKQVLESKDNKLDDVKIYSIVYDENQYAPFEKYDNSHIRTLEQKSWRFEYNAIYNILHTQVDNFEGHVGIFSWKFSNKTGMFPNLLYRLLRGYKYNEYDFINLAPKMWKDGKDYLQFSEEQHKGLLEGLKEVCEVVGLSYTNNPKIVNFSNFYLMKRDVYRDFVGNYVIPAFQYMEENRDKFFVDANYKSGVSNIKELTGLDYYPLAPFVAERLILMYVEDKQLKTLNIL